VVLHLGARPREGKPHPYCWARLFDLRRGPPTTFDGYVDLPGQSGLLRLVRRGQVFLTQGDLDGRGWKTWDESDPFRLPRRVKVGVFAEATGTGTFRAVFDQFKLTPVGGKAD
jgi:hypothetical protein